MRTGKLINLVEKDLGPAAADMIEHLSVMGSATVDELEAQVWKVRGCSLKANSAPPINGHLHNETSTGKGDFRDILLALVESKYVMAVRDAHFQSPFDAREDVERYLDVIGIPSSTVGKKRNVDADEKVNIELEKRLDGTVSPSVLLNELERDSSNVEPTSNSQVSIFLVCTQEWSKLIVAEKNNALR